jgi:Putative metallopeptidase
MQVPLRVDWESTTSADTGRVLAAWATCPLRAPKLCSLNRMIRLLLAVLFCAPVMGLPAAAIEVRTQRIQIEYVAYSNPAHQQLYDLLKQHQALERLQGIFNPFRLPVDLTLRTIGCNGVANAWYMPGIISVCYEYVSEIFHNLSKGSTLLGITSAEAVIGQLFYVFAHEMGHAVYDLLKVPVLGTEEDAADYFAAYLMLQFEHDQGRRLIIGAANAYNQYLRSPTVIVPLAAFSGVHSPPAQRFYNLVCLAFGSDESATVFGDLVEQGYLPPDRARRCKHEFAKLSFAFRQLILPHIDKELARQVLDGPWLREDRGEERRN